MTPDELTNMVWIAPGIVVERNVLDVVDWIREYAPELDVIFLDHTRFDTSLDDPPYKIIERCKDGTIRVVFSCWTLDNRVKDRIIASDTQRTDVLAALDSNNEAVRKAQERQFRDQMEEVADITKHLLKSPKTTYRFRNSNDELIVVEDDKGVVKRATN